ncbi:MAG: Arc family DNA-binding protein [Pseudomonadales bacterium]
MSKRKAFSLRIDEAVLEGVQRYADDELRSLNAQIEYLLRDALRAAGRLPDERGDALPPGPGEGSAED